MAFLGDSEVGGFITDYRPSETYVPRGEYTTNQMLQDLSTELNLSREEVANLNMSIEEANSGITVDQLAPLYSEEAFRSLLAKEEGLDSIQDAVAKAQEIGELLRSNEELSAVDRALAKDPRVGAMAFRNEVRTNRARRKLIDMMEQMSGGVGETVAELLGIASYGFVQSVRDFPQHVRGEGTERGEVSRQWEAAIRNLSEEDFNRFVQDRVDAITSGITTGKENSLRVLEELEALDSAGYILWDKETGLFDAAFTAIDIASIGTAAVVSKLGKSTVGRLRATAGTDTATSVATKTDLVVYGGQEAPVRVVSGEVLEPQPVLEDLRDAVSGPSSRKRSRKGPRVRDDVEEAVILDDIIPSTEATTITPRQAPPTSAGSISRAVVENEYVRRFLVRQAGFSFGTLDLDQVAEEAARLDAKRMADAASTSLIDQKFVGDPDIAQREVDLFFGRDDGEVFQTFDSALKAANNTPNSRIVDLRTGTTVTEPVKGGEYAVAARVRPSVRDSIGTLDMAETTGRSVLGRLFGKANIGTSSELSTLAEAGEAGSQGFMQDFKENAKRLRKLPKKDRQALDDVITALRDTPNGGQSRAWLTPDEFVDAYRRRTGSLPSRKVIEAYEDTVAVSDFNWYVKANDRLRGMADQKASIVKVKDSEVVAFPTTDKVEADALVWDAAKGERVRYSTLPEDVVLLRFASADKSGSKYVVNFYGKTRAPTLEDAFPYNAGGPRSNPDLKYFAGSVDGNWATLIGARSEKDARLAVEQFNRVAAVLRKVKDVDNIPPESLDVLNRLVKQNNDWNPNIETIEDFVSFYKKRGISIKDDLLFKQRDAKISGFLDNTDKTILNLDLANYISYHRHDQALLEYGGVKAENPDPVLAIQQQFIQMAKHGAHTQYRMTAPTQWVKTLEKSIKDGSLGVTVEMPSHPMTDEKLVRDVVIKGDTKMAKILRNEQSVINRRLTQFEGSASALPTEMISTGMTKAGMWAQEAMWDATGSKGLHKTMGFLSDNVLGEGLANNALSLGFWSSMATPDQLLLQASHFIPIVSVEGLNGIKALHLATVFRQAARNGDSEMWQMVSKNLGKSAGIDEEEVKNLLEHLNMSGRGYLRGAIAEDPTAILGSNRIAEAISAPYYAGENYAATLSRIAAYFRIRSQYPELPVNGRTFTRMVADRDRDLAFSLTRANRSLVQSDPIMRVATQWTSYPLRTIENIAFAKTFTPVERARLTATMVLMWGTAGLGLHSLGAYLKEELNPMVANTLVYGVDNVIDGMAGVKIGQRLALNPIELFDRGVGTFVQPGEYIPSIGIAGDTAKGAYNLLSNAFSGRFGLLGHDVETLARAWKIVDAPMMAYSMHMEDMRRKANGTGVRADFTPTQEVLQAIGISPSQVYGTSRASNLVYSQRTRRDKAKDKALPYFRKAVRLYESGDYGAGSQALSMADAIVESYSLTPTRKEELREAIFRDIGFDRVSWLALQLLKDGASQEAIDFSRIGE